MANALRNPKPLCEGTFCPAGTYFNYSTEDIKNLYNRYEYFYIYVGLPGVFANALLIIFILCSKLLRRKYSFQFLLAIADFFTAMSFVVAGAMRRADIDAGKIHAGKNRGEIRNSL